MAIVEPSGKSQDKCRQAVFPSARLYLFAAFSFILPIVGVILALTGGAMIAYADASLAWLGWSLVLVGLACIVLDILLDVVWAHPSLSLTDEPTLNRPANSLVGRAAIVAEPIINGRGKVMLGDTIWLAEGPDMGVGETVKISGTRDMLLVVARNFSQ